MKQFLLSLLLLASLCADTNSSAESNATSQHNDTNVSEVGEPSVTFTLPTLEGKTIEVVTSPNGLTFKGFENRVVFLSFFGYNCPPCLKEIPEFVSLKKKLPELEIIAIEVRGLSKTELQAFAKEKAINYPLVRYDDAQEFTSYIANKAQWRGSIPFIIILDRQAEVRFLQAGMIPARILENVYDKLSKE